MCCSIIFFEWGEAKDSYTAEHPKRLSFTDNIEYISMMVETIWSD